LRAEQDSIAPAELDAGTSMDSKQLGYVLITRQDAPFALIHLACFLTNFRSILFLKVFTPVGRLQFIVAMNKRIEETWWRRILIESVEQVLNRFKSSDYL
jgi:hypothetical protein